MSMFVGAGAVAGRIGDPAGGTVMGADGAVGPEWRLLEMLAVLDDEPASVAAACDLATSGLDPDLLVVAAARHNMLALLGDFMLTHDVEPLPPTMRRLVFDALSLHRYWTAARVTEAERVVGLLARAEITVACNKG